MTVQDVLNSISWASNSPPWPPTTTTFPIVTPSLLDQIAIQRAIINLYNGSATARSTLEAAAMRGDLNFSAAEGGSQTARTNAGFNIINLDFQQIKDLRYFNDRGFVVSELFELTLIHEIIHSEGLDDTDRAADDTVRNFGTFDFDGDVLRKQNIIANEIGYLDNKQISYDSTPLIGGILESFFQTGTSYSEGNKIEVARYARDGGFGIDILDLSSRSGTGSAILFGLEDDDILTGNRGRDYLYGGNGDDILVGLEGDDRLDGGAGTDTARYTRSTKSVTITYNGTTVPTVSVSGADVGSDTLIAIERIEATDKSDIFRYNGDIPAGYNLTIDGGAGIDSANFTGAAGSK